MSKRLGTQMKTDRWLTGMDHPPCHGSCLGVLAKPFSDKLCHGFNLWPS